MWPDPELEAFVNEVTLDELEEIWRKSTKPTLAEFLASPFCRFIFGGLKYSIVIALAFNFGVGWDRSQGKAIEAYRTRVEAPKCLSLDN